MEELIDVKRKIYATSCGEYMYDGMYCSEPIMTIGENGLMDNYFTYGYNKSTKMYTKIYYRFGIDSNKCQTMFVEQIDEDILKARVDELNEEECKKYLEEYTKLFPMVRESLLTELTDNSKKIIKEYYECLYKMSGEVLWAYYMRLFPDFFEWYEKVVC